MGQSHLVVLCTINLGKFKPISHLVILIRAGTPQLVALCANFHQSTPSCTSPRIIIIDAIKIRSRYRSFLFRNCITCPGNMQFLPDFRTVSKGFLKHNVFLSYIVHSGNKMEVRIIKVNVKIPYLLILRKCWNNYLDPGRHFIYLS